MRIVAFRHMVAAIFAIPAMLSTATAQELSDKTIIYKIAGVWAGTYKIFIAASGKVYETDMMTSKDTSPSGTVYEPGKILNETNSFIDTTGGRYICDVTSEAKLSAMTLSLEAKSRCSWPKNPKANGIFYRQVVVQFAGESCRTEVRRRSDDFPRWSTNNSIACRIEEGNKLAPTR